MKPNRIAAAALVAGGLALAGYLAGCGSADAKSPASATPLATTPGATPSDAAREPLGPLGTVRPGSVGQDVRYLDQDGRIKNLDVPDFPR